MFSTVFLFSISLVCCSFVCCCCCLLVCLVLFFHPANIYSRPRRLSHCCKEAVEKIKESARGTMGRGRYHRPRALSISLLFLFLLGHPAGASAGE